MNNKAKKIGMNNTEETMKAYLNNDTIFVKNNDNLVYKCSSMEIYDGDKTLRLNLSLVCCWDYINTEESDVQGWCNSDSFAEDVQSKQEICYVMEESIIMCLEANGYEILKECPLKCTGCASLCEEMSVTQCKKNLSLAFDARSDKEKVNRNYK